MLPHSTHQGVLQGVYISFVAAVTNHRKLGGLKQQKCILSQFRTGHKSAVKVSAELLPSWGLRERICSMLLSLSLVVASNPWWPLACGQHYSSLCLHSHTAFSLRVSVPVSRLPSSPRDISHVGFRAHPPPVRPHHDFIVSAKSLFPNQIAFTDSGG